MNKRIIGLPDGLISLLSQADKQKGFPQGTMAALMQQEIGGNTKYIDAPDTYHYGLNAEGRRIAGHTGKDSTATGPFGILRSTGAKPGYGVKPMGDWTDINEHIRFSADYLAARARQAGSLEAGLSGYGEGGKYGKQVMSRLGKSDVMPQQAPVVMAKAAPIVQQEQVAMAEPMMQAPVEMPPVVQTAMAPMEMQAPAQETDPVIAKQWYDLQTAMPEPVLASAMQYGGGRKQQAVVPNIRAFTGFKGAA